jgi:uncharacterized DUF497 family protein
VRSILAESGVGLVAMLGYHGGFGELMFHCASTSSGATFTQKQLTITPARRVEDNSILEPGTTPVLAPSVFFGNLRTGKWSSSRHVLRLCIRMRYEWDEEKNRLNQKKHGVSFEMAALVFEDEYCLVGMDRVDETGEHRWHAIGAARRSSDTAAVLFVVLV